MDSTPAGVVYLSQINFYKYVTAQPLFIIIKIQQNQKSQRISYL